MHLTKESLEVAKLEAQFDKYLPPLVEDSMLYSSDVHPALLATVADVMNINYKEHKHSIPTIEETLEEILEDIQKTRN
jgi:hypothetical protein